MFNQRKYAIIAAIKAAVEKMEKSNRMKAASYPADRSAPDGVASQGERISDLREALRTGAPHKGILNLRRVTPRIGQKIQVTCQTHCVYWSQPGVGTPNKVKEAPYKDAAKGSRVSFQGQGPGSGSAGPRRVCN